MVQNAVNEYKPRLLEEVIRDGLRHNPAVALLGPRQVGKSTLAQRIVREFPEAIALDLERPSDHNKLRDPEAFLALHRDKLVCLDEIQRVPDLFPALRSIIDQRQRNGQFLILGSASRDLIRQSSESLAGRIAYLYLTPFLFPEVNEERILWLRGGFPRSYLAASERISFDWRSNFIRSYLERELPTLGFNIPAELMERLWRMCAHSHGQTLNLSKLGDSLALTSHKVKQYLEILTKTFLVRLLPPHTLNLKKRLIRSPKIYIRDSGLLHALLKIETYDDLYGHPGFGTSYEGFIIENVLATLPRWEGSFYRTSNGAEIDCVLQKGNRKIAIEIKASSAPKPSRGFWQALTDLKIEEAYIIAPVADSYPYKDGVWVVNLSGFLERMS